MRQWLTILLGFFAVCSVVSDLPAQDGGLEYQVKAAFLFNFAKFVDWPPEVSTGPFTICLVGDPFGPILENTLRGETLQGRPLTVQHLGNSDDPRQCRLIYFSEMETARTAEIMGALDRVPVLTVGETNDFIGNGGMIRFTEAGRRVQFEINPDAAARNSLKISSRLLRLASIVRPRQTGGPR